MLALLPTIKTQTFPKDPVLGETTVNIGTIHGGTAGNIVPALCEAEVMFRLVGDVKPVKQVVEAWAKGKAEIEYGSHIPAQKFHTIPGFEVAAVAYTTDIPLLTKWGTPLLFGPGSILVAHTSDEHVRIAELESAVESYVTLARACSATSESIFWSARCRCSAICSTSPGRRTGRTLACSRRI